MGTKGLNDGERMSQPVDTRDAELGESNDRARGLEGTENVYTGAEPFFTYFTQPQVILSTLRLNLDGRLVAQTTDLAAQMENARRGFQHAGNLSVAVQDVGRITAQFRQRVQCWDREVQNFERDKRGRNGQHIQRIKAECAHVRSRIQAADRALVKLEVKLHQMVGEAKGENAATQQPVSD
jgi:hypothetical protein